MNPRAWLAALVTAAALLVTSLTDRAQACCPVAHKGKPVVNADQTVILIWDAATKTEHFIRRASFQSKADDFGFLVPTPSQPELAEPGDDAFPYLLKLTEPEHQKMVRPVNIGIGCTCGGAVAPKAASRSQVTVLAEKTVAGFHAAVL